MKYPGFPIAIMGVLIIGAASQVHAQSAGVDIADDLITVSEKFDYRAAAKSIQVLKFIDRVSMNGSHISKFTFGKTVEGRPMVGAIVARPHLTKPQQLSNDKRLVVLVIGNIHSGECCGQEALMKMLRELLLQPNHPWLDDLVLLLVPNYNADGNDKRAIDNRPGQVGPVMGVGQRANAQGFDLNRDYVKLESPEARALVALINEWNPHCFIDCHTTNGSWHRYQLTYDVHHNPAASPLLESLMRKKMMPAITKNLLKRGIDTFYYGNFNKPMTAWFTYGHQPRYGLDYVALRGRLAILSEAYSYVTFQERIEATHAFVGECLNYLVKNKETICKTIKQVETQTVQSGKTAGDSVPIQAELTPFAKKYLVKGYDPPWRPPVTLQEIVPGKRPSPPGKPKDYMVEFHGKFVPAKSVKRPFAYLIPSNLKAIIEKLQQHGVKLEKTTKEIILPVEAYRWQSLKHSAKAFQKHRLARATVTSIEEKRNIPKGTIVARTGQPLGNLLVYLLEPEADDGLLTWNYFDEYYTKGEEFPIIRLVEVHRLSTAKIDRASP